MKRIILTMAALLFAWIFANAQFNFGIKGGYNSSLSLDNVSSVTSGNYNLNTVAGEVANGFHGGIFARLGLGKKLYVQPELLYALQKKTFNLSVSNLVNPGSLTDVDNYVTFSTIDVPVLIGYKIVDLKLLNLRAFAGPKFRMNAGSSLDFKTLTSGATIDKTQLIGEFKKASVGMEVGAGLDILMFTLDARLNLINDVYTAKWQEKPDLNSNFVISLGWKF
ncbi:MAG: porin family protein [Paludibacter sp.]